MAEQSKFGNMPGAAPGAGGLRCEEWEALLVDALDGLLPAHDSAAFRTHSGSCPGCADLLEHAKQGQEWLGYLHTEPDVPPYLLGKILDKTMGAGAVPVPVMAAGQASGAAAMTLPLRRSFQETRLMMTVAMAFFSIALTLNLAGVKLTSLRVADLRPAAIGGALSRQFYGARGQIVHYYENLRFVYQLESRMRELRRDTDTAPAPQPESPKSSQPSKQSGSGASPATNPGTGPGKDGSLNTETDRDGILTARASNSQLPGQPSPVSHEKNEQSTEVRVSEASPISLDQPTAGPGRKFAAAGYDGRSLA